MNRDQMIEKVAREAGSEAAARRILEVILPQVTTVEELTALPDGSLLLSTATQPPSLQTVDQDHKHHLAGWFALDTQDLLNTLAPLTVVWQP